MSSCSDLIGLRYQFGANGENNEIDCIHLVYKALKYMGKNPPPFKDDWYTTTSSISIARDLLSYCTKVDKPEYDGDVVLIPQNTWSFGVVWHTGLLYINAESERVAWCPLDNLNKCRCFRLRSS